MKIAGIILAAGKSSRMGRNKLLLPYRGHTVLAETFGQLAASNVDELLVITGFESELIRREIAGSNERPVKILENTKYARGRAESVKYAIRHLEENVEAALFMVADKPTVPTALINKTIAQFKRVLPAILFVRTPTGRGHPIIFDQVIFDELRHLQGDVFGDELIIKHRHQVVFVIDAEEQLDLDTQADYQRLLNADR